MFSLRFLRNSSKISRSLMGNGNQSTNVTAIVPKRNASIRTSNYLMQKYKLEHIEPLGWGLAIFPIVTLGLGVWQIKRKAWKEDLIKQLKEKTTIPPVDFPDDPSEVEKMEYRRIRVRGKFLHDQEVYIGPRSFIDASSKKQRPGLMTKQNSSTNGYLVVTPFKLEGRNEKILVNRGWVPRSKLDTRTRVEGQIEDTVELVGIVRLNEPRPQFMPKSKGNHFLYRDLRKMCEITGSDPIFLDATLESTIPGGPIGGQTNVTLRNEHLTYVITWISLSIFSSLFWYKLVYLGKKRY